MLFAAYDAESKEEAAGYLFFGGDISTRSGKSYFPMVKMDKRKIYIDEGTRVRKVSASAPCRSQLKTRVSNRFVEALELDFGTSSMANLRRSSDAIAEMQLMETQSEIAISDYQREERASGVSRDSQIAEVKTRNEEFQEEMRRSYDEGNYELPELADTIFVKGRFLPSANIKGAYCVVVVVSQRKDFASREVVGRVQSARAKYLGDLRQGEVFDFKLRCAVSEFDLHSAQYELHLYDETGSQIATSVSRGLKALTQEQYAQFKSSLESG